MLLLYRELLSGGAYACGDLHSTMLLLYLKAARIRNYSELYLHSTMLLLYRGEGGKYRGRGFIYIPLCFYFIWCGEYMTQKWHIFTFHYASTLSQPTSETQYFLYAVTFHYASTFSLLFADILAYNDEFTFQYASTLSIEGTTKSGFKFNLHSTMLLLYPSFPAS